ncbi:putative LRR receptor-like serine/threonine-protein kinase [Iris pallida]|uniref:Disease resistance protein isoform X1 n=1 Tax=Iris pallida TaxID=29817 RepID=A0AAX6FYA3_IRIPA|nr:putative disease resistance protein isoform X1 [Iris pallida]KAJ6820961.1 putative LRR receptor-like serine/threonine-protein kinase [Iris pallida]
MWGMATMRNGSKDWHAASLRATRFVSITAKITLGETEKEDAVAPQGKVICTGAGHLRDDILHYRKEVEKYPNGDDEARSNIMDMGIKALRLYLCSIRYQERLSINGKICVLCLKILFCNHLS